ncbi:HupE/UreJ family protein [soil metagenome]
MNRFRPGRAFGLALLLAAASAFAHDLPVSYVDLHVTATGIEARIESSAKNFARESTGLDEEKLLSHPEAQKDEILALVLSQLEIRSDGITLRPDFRGVEALPARRDVRLQLLYPSQAIAQKVSVRCDLFSSDPRHKTFVNIFREEALVSQEIFTKATGAHDYVLGRPQGALSVIRQFVAEGVHHIFIGPDHILFVVGLLLLGGTIGQLLKIVTAFTLAHSVTLVLATLNILSPPARLIEPAIALSIVLVGAHALFQRPGERDWRLLFAFGFGFIHGFGFANALRAMQLPRQALGWSLFSFNAGVEIGQACIVLVVAPLLGFLIRRDSAISRRLLTAGSFAVVFAGAFWFTQRLLG